MTFSEIRALLLKLGHKATTEIDRFDVKRAAGAVIGVDVMFTEGTVTFLPVEEATG